MIYHPRNPPDIWSPLPGLVKHEDFDEQDTQPVAVESEDVKREMDKLQFPQIEGDLAPSALVPKACQSLQKQIAKLDALLESAKAAARLSPLQNRRLVIY